MSEPGSERVKVVEAGVGGKTIGTYESEEEAREAVEERFGDSPAPALGRTAWKGEYRPGHGRYTLNLRPVDTEGGY